MARAKLIFNNFSGGELSPGLEGRTDLPRYYQCVKEMKNFIALNQGGAKTRGGFHFAAAAKYDLKKARLIAFEFSDLQNYMIEAADLCFHFFMNKGQIRVGDGSEKITNGTFDSDIAGWTDLSTGTGSIAWSVDHMDIAGGASGVGWAEQSIATVLGAVCLLKFKVGANPLKLRIGTTSGGKEILDDTQYGVSTEQQVFFVPKGASTYIQFKNPNNNTSELDNVSVQTAIPYEIVSPYAEEDLPGLKYEQDDEDLFIVHPDYWPRIVTRTDHTAWTITEAEFIDGPYEDEITTPTITPSHSAVGGERVQNGGFDTDTVWVKGANWTISGGKASKSTGALNNLSQDTGEAATEIFKVIYTIDSISGGNLTVSIGGTSGTARSAPGTYTEYLTATGAGDLTFTPSAAGVACQIDNVSVIRLITLSASADLFEAGHVGALWRIKQGSTWGYVKIESYISATSVRAIVKSVLGGTSASAAHREGAWSGVNGYPRSITYAEGRLIFGGNYEHPQTVWGSKTGKPLDMTPGTLDDDAFAYTISGNNKLIRWMEEGRYLLIGTMRGEVTASGGPDSPISATYPPKFKMETTHGSADLQALRIEKAALFVQKSGRRIRELAYAYEVDSFVSPDVTEVAEHLFTADIIEMCYTQEPVPILWVDREDGALLGCTYNRYGNIVAWHQHHTDGYVESVGSVPHEGKDQLWAIVRRTINGQTKRYVEYLDPEIFVDSGLTYSGDSITEIDGLSHLEGKTVAIVADGALRPSQVVPASGALTIEPGASEIYAGLAYTPRLITNRPEVQTGAGTSQGGSKRWNEVWARVIDTLGIKINGEEIPIRRPSHPMDQGPPPYSGDIMITNLGWDTDGRIMFEQPQPLSAHIVCIFGTITVEG